MARGQAYGFYPSPSKKAEAEPLTPARAAVPLLELWKIVDAAKAFKRAQGRWDSDQFRRAADQLDACLERLPLEVWW